MFVSNSGYICCSGCSPRDNISIHITKCPVCGDIGTAISALKDGEFVTRAAWGINNSNHLEISVVNRHTGLFIANSEGKILSEWKPWSEDLLADDWIILPEDAHHCGKCKGGI